MKTGTEVSEVVALDGGWTEGFSVVARVRRLLEGLSPEDGGGRDAGTGLGDPRCAPATRGDLDEIERRLRRLKTSFPDMEAVDVGPLVSHARAWVEAPARHTPALTPPMGRGRRS